MSNGAAVQEGLLAALGQRPAALVVDMTSTTFCDSAGVRAVVLTPWPAEPAVLERSNRDTIAALGEVEVATLARVPEPNVGALAQAGSTLPWQRWVG